MHHATTRLSASDLQQMPSRYRAMLVNSLSGFKSANLLATVSLSGCTNLAMISSVFHLGADPALLGMIMRPHTVPRDSLENLLATGDYTLNHVHPGMLSAAHQTAARYAADVSEFDAVGLTAEFGSMLAAPYVRESRLNIGLRLVEQHTLQVNGTVLVIGEVVEVLLPPSVIADDGHVQIERLQSVCVSGLDHYHLTESLGRLPYAKPG
ncbi:MAG: flavin reductase family protein [Gammaproteobacteria bacterium]|nr:flavin reductase family protein [Gammaproteobacteria bacterium]